MRGRLRASSWLGLALGLGAAAGCFHEEFLLGAWCARDGDCGEGQCCAGLRCRPDTFEHCERGVESKRPFEWAYMACDADAACLVHGMAHCVRWQGATRGFCSDLCIEGDALNCEIHPDTLARACVTVDEQSLCAIDCAKDPCPKQMACLEGVCVPQP